MTDFSSNSQLLSYMNSVQQDSNDIFTQACIVSGFGYLLNVLQYMKGSGSSTYRPNSVTRISTKKFTVNFTSLPSNTIFRLEIANCFKTDANHVNEVIVRFIN
jgi:hypothetical protein